MKLSALMKRELDEYGCDARISEYRIAQVRKLEAENAALKRELETYDWLRKAMEAVALLTDTQESE